MLQPFDVPAPQDVSFAQALRTRLLCPSYRRLTGEGDNIVLVLEVTIGLDGGASTSAYRRPGVCAGHSVIREEP